VGRFLLAVTVAGLLFAPATARAAVPLAACGKTAGLECAQVDVPLDRSGAVAGTVRLHVEVLPAGRSARGVMFLIAGGPGQGSAHVFDLRTPESAEFMQFLFPDYTLVAFDNRGTGASGLLDCPTLQATLTATAEQAARLAGDCAASIGPRRQYYATRDHAEDIEAVRQALGFGSVALYGVSYGTKLALAYALAHPSRVERLVLDSVVPTSLPDPLERNVLEAMPSTLAAYCAGGLCRAATRDFAGDVATLANRLEAHPIQGKIRTARGGLKTVRMTGEDLLGMVIDTDISPGLAAELPAAVRAALSGYARPLLRLFDLTLRTALYSAEDLSVGLNAATTCADGEFPWAPDTPVADRPAMLGAAIAALPAGALDPFGSWAARLGTAFYCELWPSPAGKAPLGAGPLPNVPVLAVSGGVDMRTPTASAVAVARLFPQGRVLVVPGVGHSVLTTDLSFCSQRAVRSWLASGTVRASCPRVAPVVRPLGPFSTRRSRAAPRATLLLAAKTEREAEATWVQLFGASVKLTPAGLYGGKLVPAANGSGFTLVRYSIAPGLLVSGKLRLAAAGPPFRFKGTVRVSGSAAARGTLRISGRNVSGTLGGRRVSARL
jgi:pimeloyl-ACP methyl ester carboxylesterase